MWLNSNKTHVVIFFQFFFIFFFITIINFLNKMWIARLLFFVSLTYIFRIFYDIFFMCWFCIKFIIIIIIYKIKKKKRKGGPT